MPESCRGGGEELLQRLALEAAKHFSPCEVESLVAEAREHLQESIQAQLELGQEPEEAERGALLAFGAPRTAFPPKARIEPALIRAASALGLFWSLPLLVPVLPEWANFPVLTAFAGVHLNWLWAGSRARRPRFALIALGAEAAGVILLVHNLAKRLKWAGFPDVRDLAVEAFAALIGFAGFVFAVYGLLHLLGWVVGSSVRRSRLSERTGGGIGS